MQFRAISGCHKSVKKQRIIFAVLDAWSELTGPMREEALHIIETIAEDPRESRAIYDVLIRGKNPDRVAEVTAVPVRRIYEMRRAFYDLYEM